MLPILIRVRSTGSWVITLFILGWTLLAGGFVALVGFAMMQVAPAGAGDEARAALLGGTGTTRPALLRLAEWTRALTGVAVLISVTVVAGRQSQHLLLFAWWCTAALVTVISLLTHVIGHRFVHLPIAAGRVLAVVPAFNEPPAALYACVQSLLNQTVPVDIVVVDDGSADPVPPKWRDRVRWVYQPNVGKSGAQCSALRMFCRDEYDYILTVDSDSVVFPDALEHLLRAMSNPRIWAATGWMYVGNHDTNLVTAAADIDIGISCVMGRASRSMLGALDTTSGALSLYRSQLVFDHLEEYASNPRSIDDDRWLTTRALRRGRVVAVNEAVVVTCMPENLAGTWGQRTRWARSWFSVLPYVVKHLPWNALVSPTTELLDIIMMPVAMCYLCMRLVAFAEEGYPAGALALEVLSYLAATFAVRLCQSALYLIGRAHLTLTEKLYAWTIGTLSAMIMGFLVLMPARYWALLRIHDKTWGTRGGARRRAGTRVRASAIVVQHRYRPDGVSAARSQTNGTTAEPEGRHAVRNDVTMQIPGLAKRRWALNRSRAQRTAVIPRQRTPGRAAPAELASLSAPHRQDQGTP